MHANSFTCIMYLVPWDARTPFAVLLPTPMPSLCGVLMNSEAIVDALSRSHLSGDPRVRSQFAIRATSRSRTLARLGTALIIKRNQNLFHHYADQACKHKHKNPSGLGGLLIRSLSISNGSLGYLNCGRHHKKKTQLPLLFSKDRSLKS